MRVSIPLHGSVAGALGAASVYFGMNADIDAGLWFAAAVYGFLAVAMIVNALRNIWKPTPPLFREER